MSSVRQQAEDLLGFIDASPSPWHAAATIASRLQAQGFQRLQENADWQLTRNSRYYVIRDDSSLIAFITGMQSPVETGFKILGAHTDSPGLRLKPNPLLQTDNMQRLALDIYGGPILASFTDRDLSLAGRIAILDADGQIQLRLLKFPQTLLRLPNLAIHLNRTVNEDGLKLNKQTELAAIFSASANQQIKASQFLALLSDAAQVDADRILSWELAVYDTQPGAFWGAEQEFISNSQLDNLASCHAGLTALLMDVDQAQPCTRVCAFFDHEEVGSESSKGAAGSFLSDVLQRLLMTNKHKTGEFQQALAQSFMVSADMAHAYQPNYPGSYEPNHRVFVNQGPVIKINVNQRYATDCHSEARFIAYCRAASVPYQKYAHRGDLPCGSTIGPLSASRLGVSTVDVGSPMWAMHSIRESAGVHDHGYMIKVLQRFFCD